MTGPGVDRAGNLGVFEVGANNCEQAIELLERALAIDTQARERWGCAMIQANLTGRDAADRPGARRPTGRCASRPPR